MVTMKVKGGTPESCESLCQSCTRGHIIKGFRATEVEVFCRTFYIEREIRFPVRECTFYEDKRLATKDDMEEIAWNLRSTITRPVRDFGFANGERIEAKDGDREVPPAVSDETERQE